MIWPTHNAFILFTSCQDHTKSNEILKAALVNLTIQNYSCQFPFSLLAPQYHLCTWPHIFSVMKCSILSSNFQTNTGNQSSFAICFKHMHKQFYFFQWRCEYTNVTRGTTEKHHGQHDKVLWEIGGWVLLLLGCGVTSLDNRCPTFWDRVVVSFSRVNIFFIGNSDPWWWNHHTISKHQPPIKEWHSTTSKKRETSNALLQSLRDQ